MGWIKDRWDDLVSTVAGEPPVSLTYIPNIEKHSVPNTGETLTPDECYIELYLESLRLERARRFGTRFHGLAYSMVAIAREGEPSANLSAVSKPEKLAELDKDGIGKVITVSKQMMAPTAFRGGAVSLEFGLFSVKAGNVLSPFMDYITKVSDTAGISSVNAVKPFLPLIVEGMDLLAGVSNDTALEVGVDTDIRLSTSGVSAIIAKEKDEIDATKLELKDDGTLLHDGQALKCGYATFSFRKADRKADYGEIKEIETAYKELMAAIRRNDKDGAKEALQLFRHMIYTSPDLIDSDARTLYQKAKSKFDNSFAPTASVAKPDSREAATRSSGEKEVSLYDLKLYDE